MPVLWTVDVIEYHLFDRINLYNRRKSYIQLWCPGPCITLLAFVSQLFAFWKLSSEFATKNLKNLYHWNVFSTCIFHSQYYIPRIINNYSIIEIHKTWLLPYLLCINELKKKCVSFNILFNLKIYYLNWHHDICN